MGAAAAASGGVTDLEGVRPRAATIQRGEGPCAKVCCVWSARLS